jgi:hypothetical protein
MRKHFKLTAILTLVVLLLVAFSASVVFAADPSTTGTACPGNCQGLGNGNGAGNGTCDGTCDGTPQGKCFGRAGNQANCTGTCGTGQNGFGRNSR